MEVRFDLEALTQGAATDLLRKLGSARGIYLAAERQEQLSKLASDVGLEPLALRWFAEGVAAGLEPKAVLEQKADLVAFCVGNVFESLPEDAQKVAWLLRGMGRSTADRTFMLRCRIGLSTEVERPFRTHVLRNVPS